MRKLIEIATVAGVLALSTAAFADQPVPPPGNSAPGHRPPTSPIRVVSRRPRWVLSAGQARAQAHSGFSVRATILPAARTGSKPGSTIRLVCGNRQGNLP